MLHHALRIKAASFPQIIFGAGRTSTVTQNSTTFSFVPIGQNIPDRRVIVCVLYRVDNTTYVSPATVTVAGQSCSVVAGSNSAGSPTTAYIRTAIYITDAAVSGTVPNIVVTAPTGESMTRCFMSAHAIIKSTALVLDQAVATGATGTNPSSQTSTLKTGQTGIFLAAASTTGTLTGMSVSGPLTVNYDTGVVSSGALITSTVTAAGTCTATPTGTGATARTVLATWS
jgi:hypothetical protein